MGDGITRSPKRREEKAMRNMERYASFKEQPGGDFAEIGERFGYLEAARDKLDKGYMVLDMEEVLEITYETLYERL
jgi:hypothetical protein